MDDDDDDDDDDDNDDDDDDNEGDKPTNDNKPFWNMLYVHICKHDLSSSWQLVQDFFHQE